MSSKATSKAQLYAQKKKVAPKAQPHLFHKVVEIDPAVFIWSLQGLWSSFQSSFIFL